MELSNKKRVSFTKKADCIFLLNHSPTENFIRDDSHKEQSAALKFRKHMSQMHFSHEENSQFAMTRAQVLCQTVTDDAANNEHNESFAVWQEEPWSILGKLARVKAVDLIRSRKSASTARPLSSEGAREPISAKQKHVRFSEHVVTCFEYAPTEQFRFSSAHHSKLRIFNARVQMSRMFHHGINEDEASKRAIDCRAAVEEYAARSRAGRSA
eukprot:TRINITY_DN22008_c0_g1_i1.p1 TRINITY_DN22008_c0_g1~~TRINITY_DN22008_c0_g1_i1.p1  ORF type:complete len:212 (-),score=27.47 TRINITY_DN22008_c0_g1_i1:74-709(-)